MSHLAEARRAKPGVGAFAIIGAITSGVAIVATIVRTKVLARVVGPEGIGISAEVLQLVTLAMTIASVASGPALLLRIAEADRDGDGGRLRSSVRAAMGLGGAIALIATVVSVFVAPYVLPRSTEYPARTLVALAAAAAGLGVLTGVTQTLFVATSDLRAIAMTSLVPTLLSTAASITLIVAFGLRGQFYAIAIGALISFAACVVYVRTRSTRARISLRPTFDLAFARDALLLGVTGLIAGYFLQAIFVAIRATLESVGGNADGARFNGNYQAASAIGNTYFGLMLGSLGTYFMPRFAAAQTVDELTHHVRDAERFVLRVAPPVVLAAIAFRSDVIRLLYGDRFELAISILGFQLSGDIARGVAWAVAGPLLIRRKMRAFLVSEATGAIVCIALSVSLVRRFGPIGTGIAYMLTYVLYLPLAAVILRAATRVRISFKTLLATGAFTAACLATELLTRFAPALRWAMAPVLVGWMYKVGVLHVALSRARVILAKIRRPAAVAPLVATTTASSRTPDGDGRTPPRDK